MNVLPLLETSAVWQTKPKWCFTSNRGLVRWYGHVRLLPDLVVGQWFAIQRMSGDTVWERKFHRINTVHAIVGDTILATEMRSDGPWTADFGCYAIDLLKGTVRWSWYGRGLLGRLARIGDYVPGFTNELRTGFSHQIDDTVVTRAGDVLDIRSGEWQRRDKDLQAKSVEPAPKSPAQILYKAKTCILDSGICLTARHERAKKELPVTGSEGSGAKVQIRVQAHDSEGRKVWDWGPGDLGLHAVTNYYGWRLVGSKIIFLGGEAPSVVPIDPAIPLRVKRNPTLYHLVEIDAISGKLTKRFQVTAAPSAECRIEDADEAGMLLSISGKHLGYYLWDAPGAS